LDYRIRKKERAEKLENEPRKMEAAGESRERVERLYCGRWRRQVVIKKPQDYCKVGGEKTLEENRKG